MTRARAKASLAASEAEESERRRATRKRVLDVAAHHFAEHSFQGTSLRAIQREAGVNPATVHYHFGSKEALYQAVIAQSLSHIQSERLKRLARTPVRPGGRERLRRLLDAYLAPHLELAATPAGYDYARMLAFVQVNPRDAATDMFDAAVAPVRTRYVEALAPLFPAASRDRIYKALALAVAHMALTPIRLGKKSLQRGRMSAATEETVTFAAAGFEAMCGPITA